MSNPEWLYADDFLVKGVWQEVGLTVGAVHPPNTFASPAQGKERGAPIDKAALEFQGTRKFLLLNATNLRIMHLVTGSAFPEDWPGKKVRLYVIVGNFFGLRNCPAIRIRIPEGSVIPGAIQKRLKDEEDITGRKNLTVATRGEIEERATSS